MSLFPFLKRVLVVTGLFFFMAGMASAAQPVLGKEYNLVKPPQPTDSGNKIEVLEFFWYGCPHCYNLQPSLETWLKRKPSDVEFKRTPAVFQDSWLPLTRTYYAVEALGLTDKLHHEIFNALHRERIRLQDPKKLLDPGLIFDWVAGKGVDRKKFADTYNSFGINGRTQRSIELTRKFDIPGTPTIVIDGKFLTAPSMTLKSDRAIDYDRFFQVVDGLIAETRKSRGGK